MSDVTRLLDAAAAGDRQAAADLLPLVYDELRKLAAARMAPRTPATPSTPPPWSTRRTCGCGARSFESRSHFMRAAAEAMRRILVDHARRPEAAKRGAGAGSISNRSSCRSRTRTRRSRRSTRPCRVWPRRIPAGRTGRSCGTSADSPSQAAETLGVSGSHRRHWWAYARAWLRVDLTKIRDDISPTDLRLSGQNPLVFGGTTRPEMAT